MDRRQLAIFLAVVEHGGFSAAADELGISQPSVSLTIAGLEQAVGFALFERIGRGVQLTTSGALLLEPAGRVLRDFAVVEALSSDLRGVKAGVLEVSAIPTLAYEMAQLIGVFRRAHPDVVVRCPEVGPDGIAALIRQGTCDLGLAELPVDRTGLDVIPLGSQPFVLALPPGSLARGPIALADLAAIDMVATPAGTSSRARLEEALAGTGVNNVRVETEQREALVPLVLAGAGAAFLPEPMATQAAALGAVLVETVPVLRRNFGLLHRDGPLSPAASAFVDCARALPNE